MACEEEKCNGCPAREKCEAVKKAIGVGVVMRQMLMPNEPIEVSLNHTMRTFEDFLNSRRKTRENRSSFNPFDQSESEFEG
jgi:hypothetical protein